MLYPNLRHNGNADDLSRDDLWVAEQPSDDEQMKESTVVRRVQPDFRQLSERLRPDDQEPVPVELQKLVLVYSLINLRVGSDLSGRGCGTAF